MTDQQPTVHDLEAELQGRICELLAMTKDYHSFHAQFIQEQQEQRKDMLILMIEGSIAIREKAHKALGGVVLEMAVKGMLGDLVDIPAELLEGLEPHPVAPLADNETVIEVEDQHAPHSDN